jgi:hypothetical protein
MISAPGTTWFCESTTLPEIEPDVVCAEALTANSSRTRTDIALKYLIPSPFSAVCM